MFTPDNIKERLRDQPFMPVRIVTTTGQTYDIAHPDLVWVGRSFLMVGTPSPDSPTVPDHVARVALIHVTELRDIPRPSGPANGTVANSGPSG